MSGETQSLGARHGAIGDGSGPESQAAPSASGRYSPSGAFGSELAPAATAGWSAAPSPSGSAAPRSPSGSIWADDSAGSAPSGGSIWDKPGAEAGTAAPALAEPVAAAYAPASYSSAGYAPVDETRPIAAVSASGSGTGQAPGTGPASREPAGTGSAGTDWSAAALGVSAGALAESGGAGGSSAGVGGGSGGAGGSGGSGGSGGYGGSGGAAGGSGSGWGGGSGEPASSGGRSSRRRLAVLAGIAAVLVILLGGGGIYYFSNSSKASPDGASGGTGGKTGHVVDAQVKGPEQVASVTPADGSTEVNGGDSIKVTFSKPLSPSSPMPTLKPAIKGSWSVSGDTATFAPAAGIWQNTKVTISIPAGASGVVSTAGGRLGSPVTDSFTTGKFSEVRLEQDLAQLGYLPLTWAPTSGSPVALSDANAQYAAAYAPPAGSYTWEPGYPTELASLWTPNASSQVLRGAVAAFQADHGLMEDMITENQEGLIVTGGIGHRLWKAMFKALASDDTNKHGYTYALASQHYPETLTVWHNGKQIFRHLANTGIPAAPTAVGTNPVYIKYQSQIMKGTNPDGTQYADQVYWVSYFHEGEAVHYFPRGSYGFQQSLGCVELPYGEAESIWPYLTYGTLVTVTPT
jgi:hypothetical protein